MNNRCCSTCRFWDEEMSDPEDYKTYGFCLRYPPRPVASVDKYHENASKDERMIYWRELRDNSVFPLTESRDQCGEWSHPVL